MDLVCNCDAILIVLLGALIQDRWYIWYNQANLAMISWTYVHVLCSASTWTLFHHTLLLGLCFHDAKQNWQNLSNGSTWCNSLESGVIFFFKWCKTWILSVSLINLIFLLGALIQGQWYVWYVQANLVWISWKQVHVQCSASTGP